LLQKSWGRDDVAGDHRPSRPTKYGPVARFLEGGEFVSCCRRTRR
jgi:hypothetical protein